ncbi:LysE family translocator [Neolewinella litorea]|uniref:Lysine transporter LysE n=1 Tax=Neolewinella litorea TaxID=2562452 RepID=A0A4S4NH56_9BACT|nr:LysE family transporter [Neolewinella litorea]THH37518.1 hypothetical protein E4021_13930 [Neolewinella litorea]
MEYLTALLLGFASPVGAVLLPGMLNMSVATCSLEAGRWAGVRFAAGITTVFTVQAAIALIGANYLRQNPDIIELLSWWAIPVLVFLAAYFFFKWYREQHSEKSIEEQREESHVDSPYAEGVSVALVNFLAIPYYFAIGSWLMSDGILDPAVWSKTAFVLGAGAGAMAMLSGYAWGARWIDAHAHYVTRHFHLIVGSVFVLLAGIQAFRMLGD